MNREELAAIAIDANKFDLIRENRRLNNILAAVTALVRGTDGGDIDGDVPADEIRRALAGG